MLSIWSFPSSARLARGLVAGGEELVEQAPTKRCPDIAVAATGVWVIDTERYRGKVQIVKPPFGKPTLTIAGRDKTKLVDGLAKQWRDPGGSVRCL